MFEIWVSIALLGLWSCIGVIYKNSRKNTKQFEKIISLLEKVNTSDAKDTIKK